MKRQGQRNDLTSDPVGPKSGTRSNAELSNSVGESATQIKRYIRLTELIPEILEMVDEGRIAFRPAVELSYLTKDEQRALHEAMEYTDATPSLAQAIKLKAFSQEGKLGLHVIESIMSEEKPNQREKISFRADRIRRYIPESVPMRDTEEFVCKALEYYGQYLERQRRDRDSR